MSTNISAKIAEIEGEVRAAARGAAGGCVGLTALCGAVFVDGEDPEEQGYVQAPGAAESEARQA